MPHKLTVVLSNVFACSNCECIWTINTLNTIIDGHEIICPMCGTKDEIEQSSANLLQEEGE